MLKKQPMIHGLSKLKYSRQFIILVKTLARSEHNGIHIHDTHNNCQLSAECGGWKWHQHKIFERKNLFHFRYFFFGELFYGGLIVCSVVFCSKCYLCIIHFIYAGELCCVLQMKTCSRTLFLSSTLLRLLFFVGVNVIPICENFHEI